MVNFGSHLYHHDFVFQAETIPGINTPNCIDFEAV